MVVKRHRRKATAIWVALLTGFLAYVAYIVWATMQSRKDPASSIELKQEHYKFPDVMFCTEFGAGCLNLQNECFDAGGANIFSFDGFLDDDDTFIADHADVIAPIEAEYDNCIVVPLSRLTVDEDGINSGDVDSFDASFFLLWYEDAASYDFETFPINTQFVDVFFIDVDADLATFRDQSVDVRVPYSRIVMATDEEFTTSVNHMVLSLTEFTGINANGIKQERQQSFSQATTTGTQNWLWTSEVESELEWALLMVDLSIAKFEYTSIEEVDPVDIWSIIGAIGGIWQFVVTGFGLFFVFSVKQAPDRKMRNFKKSMSKPADAARRRISSYSSRTSNQDVEIDASEEDLPSDWVKKQQANGSVYYFNVLTGTRQTGPPHNLEGAMPVAFHPQPPAPLLPRNSVLRRVFQEGEDDDDSFLPPGWMKREDDSGNTYYMNTIDKTTQWKRPTQRVHSTGSSHGRPRVVDIPMAHMRRGSGTSSEHRRHSSSSSGAPNRLPGATSAAAAAAAATVNIVAASASPSAAEKAPARRVAPSKPSYRTAVHLSNSSSTAAPGTGDDAETHGGVPLPRNWQMRTGPGNRPYYVNHATKKSQWKVPQS